MTNLNLRFDAELMAQADAAINADKATHDQFVELYSTLYPEHELIKDADPQMVAECDEAKAADRAARQAAFDAAQAAVDDILAHADEDVRNILIEYVEFCYADPRRKASSISYLAALRELDNAYIMTLKEAFDAEDLYEELRGEAGFPREYDMPDSRPTEVYELDDPDADGNRLYIVNAGNLDVENRALRPVEVA